MLRLWSGKTPLNRGSGSGSVGSATPHFFAAIALALGLVVATPAQAAFTTVNCANPAHLVTLNIPQVECEALEALWDSTTGSGWTPNTNWDTLSDVNSWWGITAIGGNVLRINSLSPLNGTLPTELGNFSALWEIELLGPGGGARLLTGPIPDSLGNLSQLTRLSMPYHNLTGSIPASLGNLGNLRELHINDNQLSGTIPVELAQLSQLRILNLNLNALTGTIPPVLGNLSQLTDLNLSSNQLTGQIPPSLTGLANLFRFYISGNSLSGPVPDFSGTPSLQFLLSNNQFDFSDLEPNQAANETLAIYRYAPQAAVDQNRTIAVTTGSTLTITPVAPANPSGNDQFQWSRDGALLPAPAGTQRVYVKANANGFDAGDYRFIIVNPTAPSLRLFSHFGADVIAVSVSNAVNYTVGGAVTGLTGTVSLLNNGGDLLGVNSPGSFTFATALPDGSTYDVTVAGQPPGQTCTVSGGSGTLAGADVVDVSVDCVDIVVGPPPPPPPPPAPAPGVPPGTLSPATPVPTMGVYFLALGILGVLVLVRRQHLRG